MILCDGLGFTTLRSDDAETWELQLGGKLMPDGTGTGIDDIPAVLHGKIVISED